MNQLNRPVYCSSAISHRKLLLRCPTTVHPVHMHCPNTVHPVHMRCPTTVHPWSSGTRMCCLRTWGWTYAKPTLPPSMAIVRERSRCWIYNTLLVIMSESISPIRFSAGMLLYRGCRRHNSVSSNFRESPVDWVHWAFTVGSTDFF